tara:strand:- start:2077 stop:3078 length:1002 start_codon:yes stop_codon:yes gene_type:complete
MGSTDQIERALESWARRDFGDSARIAALKRLSGGASQETWAFEVVQGATNHRLILRRVPGGESVARSSEAITLGIESALLGCAELAGVPVPGVLGVFEPGSDLGESFVMHRIEGETIGRKILRDQAYNAARPLLAKQCGEALAGIHAVDLTTLPDLPRSNGADQIRKYEDIYRNFDLPRPVFELAFSWLKANEPTGQAAVLVHGDFRLGNLIVDEHGLASVLDWELAHIGDPREDIAWICVNSWRFGQIENRVGGFGNLDELLDAYAVAGGTRFEAREIDWWETLGSLKWGIMCMIMYEAFRSGGDPSVERAAIGRRVSETEIDLLNLLEKAL